MKSNNSQSLWTELTETQSEAVNGGVIAFNIAIASKLTNQSNDAAVLASGNAFGILNAGGVAIIQANNA